MLPPVVALQLDDLQDAANQTNPEPCTVAGTEYGHGQQVGCALNSRFSRKTSSKEKKSGEFLF